MINQAEQENETKLQIYGICRKLTTMVPPIPLTSSKADETIRYWLPEIPISMISKYKQEYISENQDDNSM